MTAYSILIINKRSQKEVNQTSLKLNLLNKKREIKRNLKMRKFLMKAKV